MAIRPIGSRKAGDFFAAGISGLRSRPSSRAISTWRASTTCRKLIAEYPAEQRVFFAKQELQRMDDLEETLRAEMRSDGESPR